LMRALRERGRLLRDAAVLVFGAAAVTGTLAWLSGLAIGQVNYISPTLQSERYLSRPAQEALWHSTNWHWLLYDPYLLVPPAVLVGFVLVFARRYSRITDTQLFLAACGLFEFLTAAYFQFIGKVQLVENHYFSSLLWAIVVVLLAFVVAEIGKDVAEWEPFAPRFPSGSPTASLVSRATVRSIPFLLVIGVALGYEADSKVPQMRLSPWGLAIASIAVLVVAIWRAALGWHSRDQGELAPRRIGRAVAAFALLVGLLGADLLLTVAPSTHRPQIVHIVDDPIPTYPMALGGSATEFVDEYQVITELPGFVGHPTYKGEQLLIWWPFRQLPHLLSPIGIFHSNFNSVHGAFPILTVPGQYTINHRRPAQILLMDLTGGGFKVALGQLELHGYRPQIVRSAVLRHGSYAIHVELIDLLKYLKTPS
ncbi:MAG: hypothetical protein WCF24_10995, partial [Acidimicrobiales bacterium]